jgi:hypothetical protein
LLLLSDFGTCTVRRVWFTREDVVDSKTCKQTRRKEEQEMGYGVVCCFSVASLASYSFLVMTDLFVFVVVHRVIDSTHKII